MFTRVLSEYKIAYVGKGNMLSTANQAVEKLERILGRLNIEHGVTFDGDKFSGLTPKALMSWYSQMVSKGFEMSTRNNYVSLLNPFLLWAVRMEYIEVAAGKEAIYETLKTYKLPDEDEIPEEDRKRKSLTSDEVKLLMTKMPGKNKVRDRAIIALFFATALRVSELCSLTIASVVDQPKGTIYLKRKGGKWKHTEVADFCYPYIEEYLKTRDMTDHTQPLFMTTQGTPCNRFQLFKLIERKQKLLDMPTGLHIMRHTVISNVEKKGGAGVARDIANHRSLSMTNKYDHTTAEDRRDAINRMDWCDL